MTSRPSLLACSNTEPSSADVPINASGSSRLQGICRTLHHDLGEIDIGHEGIAIIRTCIRDTVELEVIVYGA